MEHIVMLLALKRELCESDDKTEHAKLIEISYHCPFKLNI